jgi:hypothetical protein
MRPATFAATALVLIAAPAALFAQRPDSTAPERVEPKTIIGVVLDSAGVQVDSAELFIASLKRRASAGADGSFRFTDVKPGVYEVAARRLGYYPQTQKVSVEKDHGGIVRFALVPYVRGLPPVVSSSRRGGLSGVVGDTAFGAIRDAQISIVASTRRAVSDSTGAFYMDVGPGKHMVRITREGYASQLLTVTVPRDSGRRVQVLLRPSTLGESVREIMALQDLEERLATRNPVYSTLFTREDINKVGWVELGDIAQAGAGRRVDPACMAIVDGGPRREYIWSLRASEIEGVEVYRARPVRTQVRSISGGGRVISGNRPIVQIQPERDCPDQVYVWLRK